MLKKYLKNDLTISRRSLINLLYYLKYYKFGSKFNKTDIKKYVNKCFYNNVKGKKISSWHNSTKNGIIFLNWLKDMKYLERKKRVLPDNIPNKLICFDRIHLKWHKTMTIDGEYIRYTGQCMVNSEKNLLFFKLKNYDVFMTDIRENVLADERNLQEFELTTIELTAPAPKDEYRTIDIKKGYALHLLKLDWNNKCSKIQEQSNVDKKITFDKLYMLITDENGIAAIIC